MAKFDYELVGKIGSMALIDKPNNNINYNLFARLSKELKPGYIWVSSGATEIGRLDYIQKVGKELTGNDNDNKTDYASQGQAILMENYRRYIDPSYSVRQILVEHQHFNNEEKREHLKRLFLRAKEQNAIPIVNYNDAVCDEENRKYEIQMLEKVRNDVVECIDNDETASQIACLVKAETLLILTNVDGIYADKDDPSTLIEEISGKNAEEVIENIDNCKKFCEGASRKGANGAFAKLEYVKEPIMLGTTVIIASAKNRIKDILNGDVKRTIIKAR